MLPTDIFRKIAKYKISGNVIDNLRRGKSINLLFQNMF
ncbi:TPA: hypothetical protein ACPYAH_000891 [Streptococcus pneumoniae]